MYGGKKLWKNIQIWNRHFLKSKIRATKREMQRDLNAVHDRKLMFGREARNYLLDEDKIDSYRKYFGNSPDTVFREEKDENGIINELNNIDKCFVNDDADGIAGIMDKAKANPKLSNWTKQLIIHECKTALLELCI